jgi:hypothetical protein
VISVVDRTTWLLRKILVVHAQLADVDHVNLFMVH